MSDWLDVHALLDNELSSEERIQMQERLKTCARSQAELRSARQIKELLGVKCANPECEDLWRQCAKRISEIDRTKKVEYFVGRYAWGICSVFICFIVGAAMLNRSNGASLRSTDVMSASLSPISAPRSQTDQDKKEWLQRTLNRTMPVQPSRITVIGGASGHLQDGRRIGKAFLQDRDGRLELVAIEAADHLDGATTVDGHSQYVAGRLDGYNCIAWSDHDTTLLLAGNRPVDGLCQAADSLYSR